MTAQGVHELLQLCEEALAHPTAEREAFLDQRCAGNADLRRAVAALLAEEPVTAGFIETPAWTPERLHLVAGARLGPYEVQSLIGIGGMGEVYKARDTRLGRTVAIKLLPADLAGDGARRQRLEQEARAVSALNHPHICTLYDVSEHDGSLFLVMEHLSGETLAARLTKGALPIAQALTIGIEITEALAVAHRQGIIHRDLKPANVMLTKGGAKLLDFGLAKLTGLGDAAAAASLAHGPTRSNPLTADGMIVGTLQYMAPEQVEGKPADARTDLWAVGAILYEMVTGQRAFQGASAASLIGAILERDVAPPSARQPLTPTGLDRLVARCLAKLPDDRPDTAHDLANELRGLQEQSGLGAVTGARLPTVRLRMLRATALVLAGVVASALLTSWLWNRWRPFVSPGPVVRTQLSVRPAEEVNAGGVGTSAPPVGSPGGSRTALAWTPDGRSLIFVGRRAGVQQLYVRALDAEDAHPLAGTEGAQAPVVSADGEWVAFWAPATLKKVSLAGGPVVEVPSARMPIPPSALLWDAHGRIFVGANGPIWQIPARGIPTAVTSPADAERHIPSSVLPGDRCILYTLRKHGFTWGDEEVIALDLATGARKPLLKNAADARYVATGHLVFLRNGVLYGVRFDPERLEILGAEVPLSETVAQAFASGNSSNNIGAGQFAIAASGSLAWISGAATPPPESALVTVDRNGRVSPLDAPRQNYASALRVSPDGRRLAVTVRTATEARQWVYDLGHPGRLTPLRLSGEADWPMWSRDGRHVLFSTIDEGRGSLRRQTADGSAPPEVLATPGFAASSWTHDGHVLGVANGDLAVATFDDKPGRVQPLFETADVELWPEMSPDGRWLAYGSNASRRYEIYVQSYPGGAARMAVSKDGGTNPVWNPRGHELLYVSVPDGETRRMMAVDFEPGPPPRIGPPRQLFEFDQRTLGFACGPVRCHDIAPDGKHFYVVQTGVPRPAPPVTYINLKMNWFAELQAKVPVVQGR